ncbi:MAG: NUDIX hydrolase [Mycobacteriales bacterium]
MLQVGGLPCAGAVIRDDSGRLLLVRRRHEPSRGLWSLPGGRVEPGETAAEACVREVREETGLDVIVGDLLSTVQVGDYLIYDFAATVTGGALQAGDDALEACWCAPDVLQTLELTPGLLDELQRMGAV